MTTPIPEHPPVMPTRSGATIPSHRWTYLAALDPEANDQFTSPAVDEIADELCAHADATPPDLGALVSQARAWSSDEADAYRSAFPAPVPGQVVTSTLLNCAPLSMLAGAWLQWMSCAANAETELALRIMAQYAADVGVGRPSGDRGSAYLTLLRRHGAADGAYGAEQLPGNERVADFSFRFPARMLVLSRRPDRFTPELLGLDLCLRAVGSLPPLALVDLPDERLRHDVDMGAARSADGHTALETTTAIAGLYLRTCARAEDTAELGLTDGPRRLHTGFRWALAELADWSRALADELRLVCDPAYDMWQLICTRSGQAALYHDRYRLEGRPLSEWFRDVEGGPEPFLRSLAASGLVRPGDPDRSPLVRGLIGFRGPMFRVFSPADINVIRRWIASLPAEGTGADDLYYRRLGAAQSRWHRRAERHPVARPPTRRTTEPAPPISLRDAYHRLLNRHDSPETRRFARAYVERWLARSRYLINHAPNGLPPDWNHTDGLHPWLEDQHRRSAGDYAENADAPVPGRERVIDETIQTAPLTLIDGAWIQGFTDYPHASSMAGHFLFQTYWDELGNGERELNHPVIYRALMREMDAEPPPTHSPEFAHWPRFRDESFALPVYWLCVSRFPKTFMPEILGLNLAMELSGVGGGYRRMSRALRHHGFSTLFVDLHNTIDNVSTGHSAWAVDAVDTYMSSLSGAVGPTIWERIRAGHRSLNPPTGPLPALFARTIGSRKVRRHA